MAKDLWGRCGIDKELTNIGQSGLAFRMHWQWFAIKLGNKN